MWQLTWVFSLIPDAVLVYLVHAILIAGVVLTVLGTFSSKFPFVGEYGRLAKLIGIPLFLLGIFFEGGIANEARWRAKVEQLQADVARSEQESKDANAKIKTVVVEKIKKVKEVQVVIQDRIVEKEKIIDAECKVAPEAINILNDAAKNVGDKK